MGRMNGNERAWPAVRVAVEARMRKLRLFTAELAQRTRMSETTIRAFWVYPGKREALVLPVLGDEDGGAVEAAGLEVGEGAVGGVERVLVRGDRQLVLRGEREELPRVLPGV
jgi:hypothetical protein